MGIAARRFGKEKDRGERVMKALLIGLTPPLEGGSQRHIYELSERIECDVLTQKGSICNNKIEIKYAGHIMFSLAVYLWTLRLMFCHKKYDIIHIHDNTLYFLTLNPILNFRYKFIITVHGLKGFKFYDYFWWPFSLALSFADKVISVNKEDQNLLTPQIKFYNLKINIPNTYIPNGVDLSIYKDINPQIDNKIVYIGRIHKQKGIDLLLKAKPERIKLEIIGDTDNTYAKELMKSFNSGEIIWRGCLTDRAEIVRSLKSATVIVLPSRWEGLPLTLFESLASERPVIVSDIPAFRSVCTNNEVLFFSDDNADDLKQKIFKVLNDNNFALELGKRGKILAEGYDWNAIVEKTKSVYNG